MNQVRAKLQVNFDPGQDVVFLWCENKAKVIRRPSDSTSGNLNTVAKIPWYETEQTYALYNYSHCEKYLIHLWEAKSNKNKILILQKCAFVLMFFGNFYE